MKKTLFIALIAFVAVSAMAQDAVDLKLNPEKNKTYRFRSVSGQNVSQTVNGVTQASTVNSVTVSSIKVLDIKPEFFVAEVRFDSMVTITNSMGKPMTFTSTNPGNMASDNMADVMSCIMNRLSNNPLFAKISYTGKVIELVNFKLVSGILLKDTAKITGATASMLKTQVSGYGDPKTLIALVEMITGELPGKPVKKGDTWNASSTTNSGGMSLEIANSYELTQTAETVVTVNAESDIHPALNAAPMNYGPATVNYQNLRGSGKTVIELDRRTGLTLKSNSKTHISGNLQVSGQGFNMQMPMEITGESGTVAIQ